MATEPTVRQPLGVEGPSPVDVCGAGSAQVGEASIGDVASAIERGRTKLEALAAMGDLLGERAAAATRAAPARGDEGDVAEIEEAFERWVSQLREGVDAISKLRGKARGGGRPSSARSSRGMAVVARLKAPEPSSKIRRPD